MLPLAFVFVVVALQAGVTWWLWRDPITGGRNPGVPPNAPVTFSPNGRPS
jgi:hypothetical protein